jgi:hypothetical protein
MKKGPRSSARGARALKNEKGMMPKKSNFSHIPDPVGKMKKKGEKEYRRQQERAGLIRKIDDGKGLIVPIARREILAGEMRKAI